jgi:predicted DNA binding CopG/RHH family protein
MSFFLSDWIVELGELASLVSRLLTACLGSKRACRALVLDEHDQFLLDNAISLVGDVLSGLNCLAAGELMSAGAEKNTLFNCVVQAVSNKRLGNGNELRTVMDHHKYFQSIEWILKKMRVAGLKDVTERQIDLAQRFFLELANTLPFEDQEDGTRLTISMDEVLLRELKRAAQAEGLPVHKLVSEIILDHLAGDKAVSRARE